LFGAAPLICRKRRKRRFACWSTGLGWRLLLGLHPAVLGLAESRRGKPAQLWGKVVEAAEVWQRQATRRRR